MAHWLVKSEPDTWSWTQHVKKGAKGEPWTGVRNHQAKLHLATMKEEELCFFYHSGEGKEIVGIVEVIREAYPDPTAESGPWICVDLKATAPFKKPVTLAAIKAEPNLKDMVLVRNSRLSVQPVSAAEWTLVCKMGGVKA